MRYGQFVIEENRKDGQGGIGHQQGYYSNHMDFNQNTLYPPDLPQWDIPIASKTNAQPQGSLYLGVYVFKTRLTRKNFVN